MVGRAALGGFAVSRRVLRVDISGHVWVYSSIAWPGVAVARVTFLSRVHGQPRLPTRNPSLARNGWGHWSVQWWGLWPLRRWSNRPLRPNNRCGPIAAARMKGQDSRAEQMLFPVLLVLDLGDYVVSMVGEMDLPGSMRPSVCVGDDLEIRLSTTRGWIGHAFDNDAVPTNSVSAQSLASDRLLLLPFLLLSLLVLLRLLIPRQRSLQGRLSPKVRSRAHHIGLALKPRIVVDCDPLALQGRFLFEEFLLCRCRWARPLVERALQGRLLPDARAVSEGLPHLPQRARRRGWRRLTCAALRRGSIGGHGGSRIDALRGRAPFRLWRRAPP